MNFRIEEKILLHKSDKQKLIRFILREKGKKLYEQRKIESIYFDNKKLQLYKDSEEGVLPRKKIRIRSYNGFVDSFFEVKISSVEGKFKKNKKISKTKLNYYLANGFNDNNYGLCYPMTKVSYLRNYYVIKSNVRLTVDQDMQYTSYKNKSFYFKDLESLILEIKTKGRNSNQALENIIPFNRVRVSKYCTSIDKLLNKSFEQKLRINL